ncbi:MAG: MBL fold metallo-hydrolase [Hyphomicrobiaceae bacterium]|nr:MBL fold metallo-hydrolase [Hyphomicrobiaceae bacterium]
MPNFEIAICPVTPYAQNCSLVWDKTSKRGAVIDPGGDVARLLDVIGELGLVIEKIVLTHGHIDHAGGAAELREALQAKSSASGGTGIVPIEGPHIADKFLLDDLAKQGARVGIQGARPVTPDLWLEEGGTLDIAGQTYSILHCPGHTPGSLVFVNAEARLAFVGDVIFRGSVGRTDFPYGDSEALIKAITDKLLPLGDDLTFICGHGEPSTIGEERQSNPFL